MNVRALIANQFAGRGIVTIRSGDGPVQGPFSMLIPQDSFVMSAMECDTISDQTRTRLIARTHSKELVLRVESVTLSSGECDAVLAT